MLVPQLLLETLEDLGEHDFMKFKFYLTMKVLKSRKKMVECNLESPHRHDTVSKMIKCFGEEMAVNITIEILRKMKHNAADELMKTYTEGGAAEGKASLPLVTSSPALSLPTAQRISADGARGAIAPMVLNATNCSVTINGGAAAEGILSLPLITSSTALGLPTVQKISADGARGVIAPVVLNATNCRLITNEGGAAEGIVSLPLNTSSPALGLPTVQKISADGARGAIAPVLLNATNCRLIINGNVAAEGKASLPLETSSSALGLPTLQEISADGARGVIAPVVLNATNCSVIINEGGAAEGILSLPLVTSSPALGRPTVQEISADGARGDITPVVLNATNCTVTINGGAAAEGKVSFPLITSSPTLGLPTVQEISADGARGDITPRVLNTTNCRLIINEGGAAEGKVSLPLVTSSPALGLSTVQKISADGARGDITPVVQNATNCTVIINGNITGSVITAPTVYHRNY